MPNQRRTVVLNESMANLASAYLAMWQALDFYNPERERWSEPTDFGDENARRRRAEAALEKAAGDSSAPTLREDVQRYRRALRELEAGANFTESKRKLCRELLSAGNRFGHDSVSYAQQRSQGA